MEPSKILLANPQENDEKISLEQNNVVFTLELQCVTEDGEVTTGLCLLLSQICASILPEFLELL